MLPSHRAEPLARGRGTLQTHTDKKPLLAATLDRDVAFPAKLVRLLDRFRWRKGAICNTPPPFLLQSPLCAL
jgi:hypothetical protein